MRKCYLYRNLGVVALALAVSGYSPSQASEQGRHADFLKAQKAYIEAVNRGADRTQINRLAAELQRARNQLDKAANLPAASIDQAQATPQIQSQTAETESSNSEPKKKSPWRFFTALKDKVNFAINQLRELFPKLSRLQAFFVQKKLNDSRTTELSNLAFERRNFGWHRDDDISNVVNAHYTNTYSELKNALKSDCNWFECDVRLEGPLRSVIPIFGGAPRPVTAHDPFQTNGLLFDDWVKIVASSGRGIKVDLKTDNALDSTLATLKKHGVDGKKLIMNINVTAPGNGPKADEDERLKKIRNDFPDCYIKLSPGSGSSKDGKYTDESINRLIEYSKSAGKPVLYALRAEWVTPEIVKKLESHGKVSIWNTTWSFNPKDVAKEIEKFRNWGVSGIVDIMSTFNQSGH
ncbi:MAG: DUF2181 domain-containing protein [Candidatus Riflebacteria bacterium]